jgi:hypothetical protein
MADNYTQFSFAIEKLTPEECTWTKNILALNFDDVLQRKQVKEALDISKVVKMGSDDYWPDFEWCIDDADKYLWVYTGDGGNPWNAALLVRAFLAKFRPSDIKQFSVAYTCSKPRLDEFAGETYVVTSQNIYSDAGVGDIVANAIKTGQQQRMALTGLDIIVRPKKVKTGRRP